MVSHILYSTLLRWYINSKVEPSFIGEIKVAASFGGVRQYVGWLIFMYKVTSKIRFDTLLGGGVGLWKPSQWRFLF